MLKSISIAAESHMMQCLQLSCQQPTNSNEADMDDY